MSILVAQAAPDFTAPAVMPSGVIEEYFKLSDPTSFDKARLPPLADGRRCS